MNFSSRFDTPRFKVRVAVTISTDSQDTSVLTDDVSRRGVFLRMDAPPLPGQVVRLQLMPPAEPPIAARGVVVYRVMPGEGDVPGAGMQFHELQGPEQTQWESFLQRIGERLANSPEEILDLAPSGAPDPVRRGAERHALRYVVRLRTPSVDAEVHTVEVSTRGLAVETDLELPIGSEARLALVDPATDTPLDLEGVVRRRTLEPKPLVAFDFVLVEKTQRSALERLVNESLGTGRREP